MSKVYLRDPSGHVFSTEHPEYHKDCERMTRAAGEAARREQCRETLRTMLKPGSTVYTILRSVSSSGMSRSIGVTACVDGELQTLDQFVSDACGFKLGKTGLSVSGCGMDMGFHVVYRLGRALWPNGTPEPHGTRNGAPDRDGGYALRHQWV